VTEALERAQQSGERALEAELYRLKGSCFCMRKAACRMRH